MLFVLSTLASSAEAQQARAPAGGVWYGARFYQGGQFMPNASGMGLGPNTGGMGLVDPTMGMALPEPRTAYRRAARTKYRTSAKKDAGIVDQVAVATSRLKIAKNLMKVGKDEQARTWLLNVSDMNASPATTGEACQLLCEIEERLGPAAPAKAVAAGK
jgi:hypothetical protein